MNRYDWHTLAKHDRDAALTRPTAGTSDAVRRDVAALIARVRTEGDAVLYELAEQFDGVRLDALEVGADEFDAAEAGLDETARRAIRDAAANIERFHAPQRPETLDVETAEGVRCERLTRALPSVGLYVPAGSAPLPSTALMLGVPARLAGCPTRVLCSPPQSDGRVDAAVLYAARVAGIERVFRIGGAQAIAAMAYGTETVPKVNKVFGPGSVWVTEAKAQVDQDPNGAGRDLPAGPSEVLVIADGDADPAFVASDLLAQAEHGPDSQVLLVTTSAALADAVEREVAAQKARLSRAGIVDGALEHSSIIVVADVESAIAVSNAYAPEHLILQVAEARRWLPYVEAAGSVFLGPWTPESLGDYCSGTNHVLPTYGFAHRNSGLGVADFMRSMTVQEATTAGLSAIGPTAATLAALEGLDAHGASVSLRLAALVSRGRAS